MNTNPGTFPLPFVQPREIKHKLRLQKSASMKGYKLLGLLPTTTQTTKPCRKTSTPVEINMSESIEPLVQLWGQSPELWRKKKEVYFIHWLRHWLMPKMKRLCTQFSFFCVSESKLLGTSYGSGRRSWRSRQGWINRFQATKPERYWATFGVVQSLKHHKCSIKAPDIFHFVGWNQIR